MRTAQEALGRYVRIRTGNLDANAAHVDGIYPFFTCSHEPLRINTYSYDCECVLIAGNGDLNVKYHSGKFDAYQRTYIVESLDARLLDVRYLFHFMMKYVEQLRLMSIGGVIKYIKLDYLSTARIPLPHIDEQRRIAAILDQAEALRTKRRQALAKLDTLTQSLFLEMFGDPFTHSPKWAVRNLGQISSFENGDRSSNYPSGDEILREGVVFLNSKNIVNNRLSLDSAIYISEEKFSALSRGKARNGDLIITLRGTLGSCCIFKSNAGKAFINAQMMIIRPSLDVTGTFLHSLLTSEAFKAKLQQMSTGVAVPQLTASQLNVLPVIVPPLELQAEFARSAAAFSLSIAQSARGLSTTESLITSLQHQAFRGEL